MPILIAVLAFVGGAFFWYYRIRDASQGAREIIDLAERARGKYARWRFKGRADESLFATVDDPAVAATAFMVSLMACERRLDKTTEAAIRHEIRAVVDPKMLDELYVFSAWLGEQVHDPETLIRKFSRLWLAELSPEDRLEFHRMATRVASSGGQVPTDLQVSALRVLESRLKFTLAKV